MHSLIPRKSYIHPKGSSGASRPVQVASHVYTSLIVCRASHCTVWRSQDSYRMLGDLARSSTSPQATRPFLARITCAVCSRVRHVRAVGLNPGGLKFSSGGLCANFGSAQSSCESHHLCLFPSRNNDRLVGFLSIWSGRGLSTKPEQASKLTEWRAWRDVCKSFMQLRRPGTHTGFVQFA